MVKSKFIILGLILGWTHCVGAQVMVQPLPSMSAGTGGIATAFTAEVWGKNPKADVIIRQIREMKDVPLSSTEKEILRQILLTDVGGVAAFEEKQEAYLTARLETLYGQRMYRDVLDLIHTIPKDKKTDAVKQLEAKALFATGKTKEACDDTLTTAFGDDEAYVQVACAYRLKSENEAGLAYDVYREAGGNHPLMNLAGDVLFRNIKADLPVEFQPDIFEEEMGLKAYGDAWIQKSADRAKPTGKILEKLKAYAIAREELVRELPPDLQGKLMK